MKLNITLVGIGVMLGVTLAVAGTMWLARPPAWRGVVIEPPVPASNFVLTDQRGETFQLKQQAGQVLVLYFGYTTCPDECPATLAQFKQVKAELGRDADRVRFILITVDPETDHPAQLAGFLEKFDVTFTGLTGTRSELAPVWDSYGVQGDKQHVSRIYALDLQGNLRLTYAAETPAIEIASDLRQLLRNR